MATSAFQNVRVRTSVYTKLIELQKLVRARGLEIFPAKARPQSTSLGSILEASLLLTEGALHRKGKR
jgi:hypothetical protein